MSSDSLSLFWFFVAELEHLLFLSTRFYLQILILISRFTYSARAKPKPTQENDSIFETTLANHRQVSGEQAAGLPFWEKEGWGV